ncbi:MAG: glycosyltransferase [Armatimonas sp.]
MSRPAILFLAHLLPWPLEGGGQIKSYHFLKALAEDYDITLLAFIRSENERASAEPLRPLCAGGIELISLPRGKVRDLGIAARSALTGRSFIITRDDAATMHEAVTKELAKKPYAALHVDHLQMASFVPKDTRGAKVVLDEHNVEYRIPQRLAATSKNPLIRAFGALEWRRLRAFEREAILRADLTIAVSDEDRHILQALSGASSDTMMTVPIGVDTVYFGETDWKPGGKSLLSVGTMYWPPNVDAALYFYQEIFPKIRQQMADSTLCLVGPKPTAEIVALGDDPTVTVTGLVPDIRPYAERCGVFIVPLRSGSGMRVKILNAMAMGTPVVSTVVGAEGIDVTDGENILLADSPEAFANACLRVLRDPALACRLATGGRALMARQYSWDTVGAQLRTHYRGLLGA